MIGPTPSFRVFRVQHNLDNVRGPGKAMENNALQTWDSAWDYFWYLSKRGYTAWVEPA